MKPCRPETGDSYIVAQGEADKAGIYKVKAFKEKPNKETALKYVEAGNLFWNAGIFAWMQIPLRQLFGHTHLK